jgi:hypothetical protein
MDTPMGFLDQGGFAIPNLHLSRRIPRYCCSLHEEILMKRSVAILILGMSLVSSAAVAAERTTDAALGAVSGAVVLGPIGAVAGALVGYTAGPAISHSWGMRHSGASRRARRSRERNARASMSSSETAPAVQASAPPASPAPQRSSAMPPVQTLE